MEKTLKKITQSEMIKRISAESNYTQYAIKDIIDCMDHVIVSMLAEANPDDGCEIKVSKHIKAGVRVLNPSTKYNITTGEMFETKKRTKPWIRLLNGCKRAVNDTHE